MKTLKFYNPLTVVINGKTRSVRVERVLENAVELKDRITGESYTVSKDFNFQSGLSDYIVVDDKQFISVEKLWNCANWNAKYLDGMSYWEAFKESLVDTIVTVDYPGRFVSLDDVVSWCTDKGLPLSIND